MSEIRCIAISTGGGVAPGLNAVIRGAVKSAILKYKWKVIGIPDGFEGLIWPEKSFALTLNHVSGILPAAALFWEQPTAETRSALKRLKTDRKSPGTFLGTSSPMPKS
jgi:6-phosphofructokinase